MREVTGSTVRINLVNISNCGACHAKAGCGVSSSDAKVIEVVDTNSDLVKGQQVRVSLEPGTGFKALLLGYILPFFVLIVALITSWTITGNEALSGGIALGSLVPYYIVLALFRDQLKTTFSFRISRI